MPFPFNLEQMSTLLGPKTDAKEQRAPCAESGHAKVVFRTVGAPKGDDSIDVENEHPILRSGTRTLQKGFHLEGEISWIRHLNHLEPMFV